eukprot:8693969-Pyramimonas_sp.AAC.1
MGELNSKWPLPVQWYSGTVVQWYSGTQRARTGERRLSYRCIRPPFTSSNGVTRGMRFLLMIALIQMTLFATLVWPFPGAEDSPMAICETAHTVTNPLMNVATSVMTSTTSALS